MLAAAVCGAHPSVLQATEIGDDTKAAIVETVCADVERVYVFADDARTMSAALQENLRAGAYGGSYSREEFVARLTADLRGIRDDLHLEVVTLAEPDDDAEIGPQTLGYERRFNYLFRKVEILEGNVGYLALDKFCDADEAGDVCRAAMSFLARTDALIIDLRENRGGGIGMIQLLQSYLLPGRQQLSSLYVRQGDATLDFWTQAFVAGKRMDDVPLYVLVSQNTFSGGEALAYDLKHMGRGKIVGEVTAGGAHPTHRFEYPELQIMVKVPFARAVSPVTGTNWEGVGVQPDLPVPAEQALAVAHAEALRTLMDRENDDRWRATLEDALKAP
jgi:C-terminal processing protease CtpA/Prc